MTPPVNPDATARLVEALRAIVDWENRESDYTIPVRLINDANNALHMAQLPVVPVSEDVHLRLGPCRCHDCARARSEDVETIRKELQNDPLWMEFQTNALAALDRLASAAGRNSGASRCAP